jgi:hypothetical protein
MNQTTDSRLRRLGDALLEPKVILAAYLAAAAIVTAQQLVGTWLAGGDGYTGYNNYVIFRQSFLHLVQGKDLYAAYPGEHWDFFKYSPTFAILFAPFAILPDAMGLLLWNALNVAAVYVAFRSFPDVSRSTKGFMLWFVALELLTSIQNAQSNGLVAGLIILAFVCLERRAALPAALLVALSIYVKLFGLVAFVLFLLYPSRRRAAAYSLLWLVVLGALPLLAVSPGQLGFLYGSWADLLAADHTASHGLSVMGWLSSWFGLQADKDLVVLGGAALLLLPFLRVASYRDFGFRVLALASVLIWVVIFNHKAESPTYIIAMSGVTIWYFPQLRRPENLILLVVAFVLTSLSPTDLFPSHLREAWVRPYHFKAVPCIIIWGKIVWEMAAGRYRLKESF